MIDLWQAPWQKRIESLGYCEVFGLSPAAAILSGAGISSAGSLAGGKKGASGATQAASIQAAAEEQALQLQQQIYANNQNELQPFINFGQAYMGPLDKAIGNLMGQPPMTFQPTQTQLAQFPGYQFVQNQTQAQLNNQGTVSGPGGAVNYQKMVGGAGVASTYENQFFNQWLQGNELTLQQLGANITAAATPVQTGLSAAGALAGVGVASGANMAQTLGNIGSALGGGVAASTNALTAGLGGATNAIGGGIGNLALINALGAGGSGAGAGTQIASLPGVAQDYSGGGDVSAGFPAQVT